MQYTMENLALAIKELDDDSISQIIQAIISRYGKVHPESEVFFLSVPKDDPALRRQTIQNLIEFLQKNETDLC